MSGYGLEGSGTKSDPFRRAGTDINAAKDGKSTTGAPGTSPMMTQQPFMPGMDTMLAEQLAKGGYGTPGSLLDYFSQIYTPMQVYDTRPGATPAPTTPTTTPSTGGGSGSSKWSSRVGGRLGTGAMSSNGGQVTVRR